MLGPVVEDLLGIGPTRLERIAASMGIDDEEFRDLLRAEIERRRVALVGDSPETTPRPHQHRI